MCARIAAINLFEVDLDNSWNYLWYYYLRAPMPPLQRSGGQCPRNAPPLRCPWKRHYQKYLGHKLKLTYALSLANNTVIVDSGESRPGVWGAVK